MKVTTIGDCVVFSNNAMYLENILDEIRRQFDVYSVTKCSHRVGIPRQLCCSSIHAKHVLMTIMLKACVRLEVQFGLHIPHKLNASNIMGPFWQRNPGIQQIFRTKLVERVHGK